MIKHICMSIEGLEKEINGYKSYGGKNKYCKDYFGMTYGEVNKGIEEYKNKGFTLIPSEGCKNIGKIGNCEC